MGARDDEAEEGDEAQDGAGDKDAKDEVVDVELAIELQRRVDRFAAQPLSDGLIHEIDSFSTDEHIDGSVNRHEF